jgi:hypothetical protein
MAYLLLYNNHEKGSEVYFMNVSFVDFLGLFEDQDNCEIQDLTGLDKDRNVSHEDLPPIRTIGEFTKFKLTNNAIHFKEVTFLVNKLLVEVSDEGEFHIYGSKNNIHSFEPEICKLLQIQKVTWTAIKSAINQYHVIEGGLILGRFETFDEFLRSELATMFD